MDSESPIHHQTTENTEKFMDLKRHIIIWAFYLCALFGVSCFVFFSPRPWEHRGKLCVLA
jgi:hypothetical protein